MPNINLITLAGIPGVNQAAMTQNNPNACGAYAITGATGAFGIFPRVANLAYANAGLQAVNNLSATTLADNYHQISAAVYTITGILNNNMAAVPVVPELLTAGNVYNSPAAMAQVAIDLGRPAPQINAQAVGFANLNALYPNERGRCNAVVGAGNVAVAAPAYAAPAAGNTHIVCVTAGGGLHWVAQGSDGLFYDPADGSVNNAWAPVNTGDAMGAYTFAGLWIVIS
jgi:hypothetical protein